MYESKLFKIFNKNIQKFNIDIEFKIYMKYMKFYLKYLRNCINFFKI